MNKYTVALAGNPNAGKSSIFNALTGQHQHVGNWPGKTVEKKEGTFTHRGVEIAVVDLPGTYSLSAFSPEEVIARDFLIEGPVDAVINVVDATNLERNLYLTVQILEMGLPLILVLNMVDMAEEKGIRIDDERLSALLGGVPIVRTVGSRRVGIDRLKDVLVQVLTGQATGGSSFHIDYGRDLEREIAALQARIAAHPQLRERYPARWLAIKLLEGEEDLVARVRQVPGGEALVEAARAAADRLTRVYGEPPDILIADRRYGFIHGLVRHVLHQPRREGLTLSDRIDRIVASRYLGIPIFLLVMYLLFELVVNVSTPFLDWVDAVFTGPITRWAYLLLHALAAPPWLTSLVVDGVIAGVGSIMTFLPGLMILYIFLAILEDSGYMARAAFVMDKVMRIFGLHGKAFIPMILGFGCNVPAVYATRTLEHARDRLLTGLLIPFMSCSARLPVYVLFGMAFFPHRMTLLIWSLYVTGILVAVGTSVLANRFLFRGMPPSLFVLELPPYRMPTWYGIWTHTWEHTREFVVRAGTVILLISVILWFLLNLPWGVDNPRDSYFGQVSEVAAIGLRPLGFGTWQAAGSLLTGFIAKEVVITTMGQIYLGEEAQLEVPAGSWREDVETIVVGFGRAVVEAARRMVNIVPGVHLADGAEDEMETALAHVLRGAFRPAAALAFVVFVLLYVPCVATLAAIRQEFGLRWAILSVVYQNSVAWLLAFVVYRVLGG